MSVWARRSISSPRTVQPGAPGYRQRRLQRDRHAAHITGVPERGASVWPVFNENRTLCVNTLAPGRSRFQTFLAAKRPWNTVCRRPLADGGDRMPATGRGSVSFDCRISQVVSVGTHDILFAPSKRFIVTPHPTGWCGSIELSRADAPCLLTSLRRQLMACSVFLTGS